jgi:hypothetical protein
VSVRITQEVWDDPSITGNAKLVMLKLADNADTETRFAFPGTAYISEKTGVSERHVKRILAEMVEMGKLAVHRDGGGRGKKTIYVVLPQVETVTETVTPQQKNGDGLVRAGENPGTVSGTGNGTTPSAPLKVNRRPVTPAELHLAEEVVAAFNVIAGTRFTLAAHLVPVVGRIREHPELTLAEHRAIIERQFAAPWWSDTPSPEVIYGKAATFERAMHSTGARRMTVTQNAGAEAAMLLGQAQADWEAGR